jgi:hypothetical protein
MTKQRNMIYYQATSFYCEYHLLVKKTFSNQFKNDNKQLRTKLKTKWKVSDFLSLQFIT